jgi:ABC-type transport system involved in multi-copper enzyme maturation permease subunit
MSVSHLPAIRAVLLREFRSAMMSRYVQIFIILALAGGLSTAQISESAGAARSLLGQIAMYFVSLFTLLVGVSAARAEAEEWPMLFAQPAPRWSGPAGKFCALLVISGMALLALFLPSVGNHSEPGAFGPLYLQAIGLAAVFCSLGLGVGYLARDRVQALLLAASAWVVLLLGFDQIALLAAHWEGLQRNPDVWVGILMLNPLDAFRVNTLFSLQEVPAETAGKTIVAHWWLTHTGAWLAIVSAGWSLACLFIAHRAVNRIEP